MFNSFSFLHACLFRRLQLLHNDWKSSRVCVLIFNTLGLLYKSFLWSQIMSELLPHATQLCFLICRLITTDIGLPQLSIFNECGKIPIIPFSLIVNWNVLIKFNLKIRKKFYKRHK